jgi:hypothetical protein
MLLEVLLCQCIIGKRCNHSTSSSNKPRFCLGLRDSTGVPRQFLAKYHRPSDNYTQVGESFCRFPLQVDLYGRAIPLALLCQVPPKGYLETCV